MLPLSIIVAGALVWLSAIVQHVGNLTGIGARWVMSDRSQAVRDDGFVGRSARTLRNNLESCAMYVPSALVVFVLHQSSSVIAVTADVYAAARVIFYWLTINSLRSLSWLVGMICIALMAVLALQATVLPPA
jgi:uncharacterized MAPEG superfamily protein